MQPYQPINQLLATSAFFYTISIGMDSTYTYVSPNYDRNFNFGRGTLKGRHFSVTLHPDDIRLCEAAGPLCFQHPEQLFPVRLRKHDGQGGFVITQWEMQAMINEQGDPDGIYCIGYNITDFVRMQDQRDQAENQLDEIGFIQSHSVRKPLANILGISGLLHEASDQQERRQLTEMLLTSAGELDLVIREISDKGIVRR